MRSSFIALACACMITGCGGGNEGDANSDSAAPLIETNSYGSSSDDNGSDSGDASSSTGPYETSIILTDPDGINQITWEDLMPDGEEEVLAQLYEDYYSQLEQKMRAQSERLTDTPNEEGFDVSTMVAEGSAVDTMEQIGTYNVVEDLDGLQVRLPGYVVPLDFNSKNTYDEFLLVPYFGACLHTPPPPPNQIVFVKADPGAKVESIYDPVWVEGTMKTGKFENDTGNSAYELSLSKIEVYEY